MATFNVFDAAKNLPNNCPFCRSGRVRLDYTPGSYGYHEASARVVCDNCKARGPNVEGVDERVSFYIDVSAVAVEKWNNRA